MTIQQIEEKVKAFLVEDFEIEADVLENADARLKEDVGIDSLDFVDIVVIIEREFGFKPIPQDLKNTKTLGELYAYIQEKVG